MDHSRDQLRRDLRDLDSDQPEVHRAMRRLFQRALDPQRPRGAGIDRRGFFRIGGLTIAGTAILAACGDEAPAGGETPRVGTVPPATDLPTAVISDVALLRTATSLEYNAITLYDLVLSDYSDLFTGDLSDALELFQRYRDDHQVHADLVTRLVQGLDGEPYECPNPRIEQYYVDEAVRLILGDPSADPPVEPSPDPARDVLVVAHAFEELAASTYQAVVPLLSLPALRADAMRIGSQESRHASLMARLMNPDAIVSTSEAAAAAPSAVAPTTTAAATGLPTTVAAATETTAAPAAAEAPAGSYETVVAVPWTFGNLGPIPVVIGAPNEVGTRPQLTFETPSLNSIMYEYLGACPA
jgi:hypothetical protein